MFGLVQSKELTIFRTKKINIFKRPILHIVLDAKIEYDSLCLIHYFQVPYGC